MAISKYVPTFSDPSVTHQRQGEWYSSAYESCAKIADDALQVVEHEDTLFEDALDEWSDLLDPFPTGQSHVIAPTQPSVNNTDTCSTFAVDQGAIETVHPSMFDTPVSFDPTSRPVISTSSSSLGSSNSNIQGYNNDEYKKRIANFDKILADLLRGCKPNVPVTSASMVPPVETKNNVVTPRQSFVSVDSNTSIKKRKEVENEQEELSIPIIPTYDEVHHSNKKRRITSTSDLEEVEEHHQDSDGAFSPSFRSYQTEKWNQKFEELCDFKKEKGHCNVPYTNDLLIHWVKRQRYQYKLKIEGRPSTLTDERMEKLEKVGFVWDAHASIWHERLQELKAFHLMHGHCNVPSKFPSNPKLAVWTKCQRRQWKLYRDGKSSHMTPEREFELESLGFEFEPRAYSNNRRRSTTTSSSSQ